jgi:hypothetical protein
MQTMLMTKRKPVTVAESPGGGRKDCMTPFA